MLPDHISRRIIIATMCLIAIGLTFVIGYATWAGKPLDASSSVHILDGMVLGFLFGVLTNNQAPSK